MIWFDGPIDSQHEFLWIKVFWWIRLIGLVQLLSGLLAASGLLSRQRKEELHKWMASQKNKPETPKASAWRSIARVAGLILVAVFFVSVAFSVLFVALWVQDLNAILTGRFWIATARIVPAVFALLMAFALVAGTTLGMLINISKDGSRVLMPKLAPFFIPERFDNTALLVSVVFFVLASIAQIILS